MEIRKGNHNCSVCGARVKESIIIQRKKHVYMCDSCLNTAMLEMFSYKMEKFNTWNLENLTIK